MSVEAVFEQDMQLDPDIRNSNVAGAFCVAKANLCNACQWDGTIDATMMVLLFMGVTNFDDDLIKRSVELGYFSIKLMGMVDPIRVNRGDVLIRSSTSFVVVTNEEYNRIFTNILL
ncbi:hypothetical protein KF6_006 [Vibrio phage vB_VpaS_KF6]|uniref:Uncharacterized protein n=1 Tax=Vibrio phage vB_VpaS_KF6 TaxID=2041477 RepID=A0A384WK15_9CAUD|nr:hypothetical protein KF6_006 [Vibrio phage vB_VpaS_KF6]